MTGEQLLTAFDAACARGLLGSISHASSASDETTRGTHSQSHVPRTRLPMRLNFPMSMKPSRTLPLLATRLLASSR